MAAVVLALAASAFLLTVNVADDNSETAPTVRLEFDYDETTGTLTVTHAGGETITQNTAESLRLVSSENSYTTQPISLSQWDTAADTQSPLPLTAGDTLFITHGTPRAGEEVSVVMSSPTDDSSTTLGSYIISTSPPQPASQPAPGTLVPQFELFGPNAANTILADAQNSDSEASIATYRWDFTGDGTFDVVSESPTTQYTYDSSGEYTITLKIETENGTTNQSSKEIVITASPTASLSVTPSRPTVGEQVTLDASASEGNISRYQWSKFGNRVDRTTSDPVTNFTYSSPGQIRLGVQVQTPSNQFDFNISTIDVQPNSLHAAFTVSPREPRPVVGEQVTFDASDSVAPNGTIQEYRWDFTNNGTVDRVTSDPVTTFDFSSSGLYTVALVIENNTGATDATNAPVEVVANSSFEITALNVSSPLEGEPLDATVTVENVGSSMDTQTLELDAGPLGTKRTTITLGGGQSTTKTLSVNTQKGDSGVYFTVVSTEDDSIANTTTVTESTSKFLIQNLTANEPAEGENLTVTADITNDGNAAGTQSVELAVTGLADRIKTVSLDSGVSTQVTFDIKTSQGDGGNYTAQVSTGDDVATEPVVINDPAEFTILRVDVGTTVEGDKLILEALIQNTGGAGTQAIVLDVPGLGTDEKNVTLDRGSLNDVRFSVSSAVGDAGEYTATVSSEDDSASANATIFNQAEFVVGSVETNTPVEGKVLDVTFTVENVGDVSGTQTVTLDVGALGTVSTEVTVIGNNSIERSVEVGTSAGDAGEYTAIVSSEDDSASANATILNQAEFLVDIVGTNTPVVGEKLDVTFTIENPGNISDTQTVTLDVEPLAHSITRKSLTLAGGNSTQETLSVRTDVGDAGEYTATVSSVDDSDTANVTVEAPASSSLTALDIVGQATNATLTKGTDGNVSVVVKNVGDRTAAFDVTLDIGRAVSQTQPTGNLSSGATETVTFTGVTGGLSADTYGVTVSTTDDSVSGILSVQAPAQSVLSNLVVAGQGTNATIAEGDSEDVELVVENVGDQTESFDVTLDIGTAVSQTQSTSQLSSGAGEVVTFAGVTDGLSPGEYSVDVSTADDTTSGTLTVNAPAESALSTLDIAGQGADATITEGDSESVSVVVENVGDQAGVFNITLEIGTAVTETASTSELVAGETEAVVFGSVTGNLGAGEYSVNVTTADDQTNGTLTVNPPAALSALDVAGQGASATITEGDDADISVDVENVGTGTESFDVTLEIIGNVVEVSKTVSTGQLADGASTTVTFENITGGLDPEPYFVSISTADDFLIGELIVEGLAPPEFQLTELDPVAPTVTEGNAPIDMNVTVTNQGDASDSQTLDLTVTDDDSGTVVYDDTITGIGLVGGKSQTVTFPDVPVGSLDAGSYTHEVSSANDSITGSLTVEVPAESALSGLNIARQGTDAIITAGDDQSVSVVVENAGDQTESFDVNLTIGSAVSHPRSTN